MKEKKVLCEVYARVVGYHRPTLNYNTGKKQEWSERKLIKNLNKILTKALSA
ncbi:MAG TPA: hypothetical protein EYP03_01290 [Aquificae bacterium]|nr:hypothetical protein [Aquificota bacterium]